MKVFINEIKTLELNVLEFLKMNLDRYKYSEILKELKNNIPSDYDSNTCITLNSELLKLKIK